MSKLVRSDGGYWGSKNHFVSDLTLDEHGASCWVTIKGLSLPGGQIAFPFYIVKEQYHKMVGELTKEPL